MPRTTSVCPHDCPSTCALEIEMPEPNRIGRVYGSKRNRYTAGVICAKVARYAERIHHPERLTTPQIKTANGFAACSWDEAIDLIVDRFEHIRQSFGAEAIWPYHYAGTMGLVQRDGLERLRRAYGTSRMHGTFCIAISDAGFKAGYGSKRGADPQLMDHNEVIVIWGTNPVSTQVNVMHHAARARRLHGARLVVIDPYRTKTAEKADMHLMLKPGTDGALACAVMHVLLKDNRVDHDYLSAHSDFDARMRKHLETKTPQWAADITGLSPTQIIDFARLYGSTQRSFIRLGYGFSRSRNGAVNMHAASCLPVLTGAWQHPGSGALYSNSGLFTLDKSMIEGHDIPCNTRIMDQSRIGEVLCGNAADLQGGPPIQALFIQNTNPAVVAPDTQRVLQGLARKDLFTVVHEQFMTDTATQADVVLPATMFLEHDDIYTGGGHTYLQVAPKRIDAPGECRSNHWLLCTLAQRLGLSHPGFEYSERQMIDSMLSKAGLPDFDNMAESGGYDFMPPQEENPNKEQPGQGFGTDDGRFHFYPDWSDQGPCSDGMPALPDYWPAIDQPTDTHPFRLVTAPARQFLNSSFTETASSRRMEGEPTALIHPDDIDSLGLSDGERIIVGNQQAAIPLRARCFDGLQRGTVVVESLWPNHTFAGGIGINALTSSQPAQPNGGAVFHDTAVWVRKSV